jgi:hypothetical protein
MVQKPPTGIGREGGSFRRLLFFPPDWQTIISINDSFLNFQNLLPSLPVLGRSMSSKGFRALGAGGKGRSRPPGLCQTYQGHLRVDPQCQAKYPGHGWSNAPVQPDPQHLTLGPVEVPWQRCRLYPGRAYKKPPRTLPVGIFARSRKSKWYTPG